jgi:hypothetical protein
MTPLDKSSQAAGKLKTGDSEKAFTRTLKKAIKEALPKEDAPPMPTKKLVKARSPKDSKFRS